MISLQGGNAHLGGDFQHARGQRFVIIGDGLFSRFAGLSFFAQGADAVMSQVRVHRPRAKGDEQGQVMHVPGFAAFQDHGNRRALFDADQVLFQGGNSQQGRDRQMVFVHAPVRQDQDVDAVPARLIAQVEKGVQSLPERTVLFI